MAISTLTRRRFLQVAGGTVGLAVLAACAPAPADAPAAESGTGGAVVVSEDTPLWVLQTQDFHPAYNDFVREHMMSFAAEKGYAFEVADVAGFVAGGAEMQKIAAQVAADDSPDVYQRSGNISQLRQLDLVVPTSHLVAELVERYGATPVRQERDLIVDGEWYGLPFHVRSDGGWARMDIWDAAGIDVLAIRQFDELREAALEVSDPAAEMWGWGMSVNRGGDGQFLIDRALYGFGATWVDETGQIVTIDSPEAVAAVEWLVDTYTNPQWERMLPPGVLSWTDPTNNEAYLGGKTAYTQNAGTVYANAVVNNNPVAPVTSWHKCVGGPVNQEFFGLNSMNWMKIRGGKNPEAAEELILSFFEEDVLKQVFKVATSYALPAYTNQWDWEEITSVPNSVIQKDGALDPLGWNGMSYPGPNTPWISAVSSQVVDTDMIAAVLNGQATPAEAVAQAAERCVQIFQEMGAAGVQ